MWDKRIKGSKIMTYPQESYTDPNYNPYYPNYLYFWPSPTYVYPSRPFVSDFCKTKCKYKLPCGAVPCELDMVCPRYLEIIKKEKEENDK